MHVYIQVLFNKTNRVLSLFSLLDTGRDLAFVNRKDCSGTMGNDVGVYKKVG